MIDAETIRYSLPAPPVTREYAYSFSYREDTPDDMQRRMWRDAKRQLAVEVFATLFPNRDYTIRYYEHTRPSSVYGIGTIEGTITAKVTYQS